MSNHRTLSTLLAYSAIAAKFWLYRDIITSMKTVTKPQLSKLSSNQILSESTVLYENYRLKFLLLVYVSTSLTSTSKSLQNFLFLAFFTSYNTSNYTSWCCRSLYKKLWFYCMMTNKTRKTIETVTQLVVTMVDKEGWVQVLILNQWKKTKLKQLNPFTRRKPSHFFYCWLLHSYVLSIKMYSVDEIWVLDS